MMAKRRKRQKPDPTIALINIVFLLLVFFMIAGTIRPPIDGEISLVDTSLLDADEPKDVLVLTAQGTLRYAGKPIDDIEPYIANLPEASAARIMPDRDAPALALLQLSQELRGAGVPAVLIVAARKLNE